jgi:hypothetical protein
VFYEYLAEELIDNEFDPVTRRHRRWGASVAASLDGVGRDGLPKSGVGLYLTTTKKKRKKNGALTNQLAQNNCKICKAKTCYVCNDCLELDLEPMNAKHVHLPP